MRARVRSERPDIVHTALFAGDMVGRVAAWRTGAKVVSSLVNTTYDVARTSDPNIRPWRLRVVQALDVLTGRVMVDRFHAVSAGVADVNGRRDLRVPRSRISVVQRGRSWGQLGVWSHERREAARACAGHRHCRGKVVLAVGRQEHQKAHAELVATIPHLLANVDGLIVLIAGREGNVSAALRGPLQAHPEAKAVVTLLGHRHDAPDLLCAADVLAIPSLYEGTAGAALEAMALRCPVVCTDLAGVRGVLADGVNSVLVPVADSQAMADALARVLTDAELADRLRTTGLADFEDRFTIERAAGGGDGGVLRKRDGRRAELDPSPLVAPVALPSGPPVEHSPCMHLRPPSASDGNPLPPADLLEPVEEAVEVGPLRDAAVGEPWFVQHRAEQIVVAVDLDDAGEQRRVRCEVVDVDEPAGVEVRAHVGISPVDGDRVGLQGMEELLGDIARERGVLERPGRTCSGG